MLLTSKTDKGMRVWSKRAKGLLTAKDYILARLLDEALGEAGYQREEPDQWVLKTPDWEHHIKLFKDPNRKGTLINVGYLDTLTKEDLPYLWDVIRSHWNESH